jgi:basic amino acid/polyamine antiporter, APA family
VDGRRAAAEEVSRAPGRAAFGALDGAALVVTAVVGAGIFTVPSYVASLAGSSAVTLGLWIAGGLLALAGALCYAELGTRLPRGGAEYVYLRAAFGEPLAFLSGWTSFVAGFSGAIAAAAAGFAAYLAGLVPSISQFSLGTLRIGPMTASLTGTTTTAVALIALFTLVSVAGVRTSRMATNALAVIIVAGIVVIAAAGFMGNVAPTAVASAVGASPWSALVPIFFTYSGWNAAAYVAGEFRNPATAIPRALVGGTLAVTVLYVAVNAAMLRTLSVGALASAVAPVSNGAAVTMGSSGQLIVTLLVLVALASSVCAMVVTGPRVYTEMSRDGVLPRFFGATKGRDVSVAAIVVQSLWSAVLVLTGTFAQIVTYTGFAIVVFSGAAVCALFVLRRRIGAPSGYRVPWYPWVPGAFVACCSAITIASIRYAPGPSLVGLALILAGLPLRMVLSRRDRGLSRAAVIAPEKVMAAP